MHRWSSQRMRAASIKSKRGSELYHIIPLPPLPNDVAACDTGVADPDDYIVPGFRVRSSQASTRGSFRWQTWLPETVAKNAFCLLSFLLCLITTLALVIFLIVVEGEGCAK